MDTERGEEGYMERGEESYMQSDAFTRFDLILSLRPLLQLILKLSILSPC